MFYFSLVRFTAVLRVLLQSHPVCFILARFTSVWSVLLQARGRELRLRSADGGRQGPRHRSLVCGRGRGESASAHAGTELPPSLNRKGRMESRASTLSSTSEAEQVEESLQLDQHCHCPACLKSNTIGTTGSKGSALLCHEPVGTWPSTTHWNLTEYTFQRLDKTKPSVVTVFRCSR